MDCLYEERVAIMIHDGGLSVAAAEDAAYRICYRRTERIEKPDGGIEFKHSLTANKPIEKQVAKPEAPAQQMSFEEFRSQYRQRYSRHS